MRQDLKELVLTALDNLVAFTPGKLKELRQYNDTTLTFADDCIRLNVKFSPAHDAVELWFNWSSSTARACPGETEDFAKALKDALSLARLINLFVENVVKGRV